MTSSGRQPNILLFGIDSLLATHMSCYGYRFHTTPHLDQFASGATLFQRHYSPHIPTTSGYASMLTGRDCFGTQVVALRHQGPMRPEAETLAEILNESGYNTTCIGFTGNPASRGFDNYISFEGWASDGTGRAPKARNLNEVAIPELKRLAAEAEPWMLFLRHMDPHAPYLPPYPYERMFYDRDEFHPANKSMEPVFSFKPFADFLQSWMPQGVTDKDYIIAQYDGAIAYMDACIEMILRALQDGGLAENTIVVITADHGETLYDHDCYFDHHGIYDVTLHVPLIIRYPGVMPEGQRLGGYTQHKDLVPTLLELAHLSEGDATFDGQSLMPLVRGEIASRDSEFYITECTWMRKHGWRTPQWKLIVALEPDFHFKPPVELYNLVSDPGENHNLADEEPQVVEHLRARMEAFIAKREAETGLPNPMYHQGDWHGHAGIGSFKSSQQAYDTLYIGDRKTAQKLQDKEKPQ